jgi:hypothetical protein
LTVAQAGCASLSPAGGNVQRVTDRAALARCTFLGDVSIRPSITTEKDDIIRLRNAAGELGANVIWIDSMFVPPGGHLYAGAFACRAVAPQGS